MFNVGTTLKGKMYSNQKEAKKFKNVILKGKYQDYKASPGGNSFFARVCNSSYFNNAIKTKNVAMRVYNAVSIVKEFIDLASVDDYLLNIASSAIFKNMLNDFFTPTATNLFLKTKMPFSLIGCNVSMMPTSSLYNTLDSYLSTKEMLVKNLIQAVKNRLSIEADPNKSKYKKEQYIIKFKPFKSSKYFEAINNAVKKMVIDININLELSKKDSASEVFDRYLDEQNKSYFSSIIGQASKLTLCSTSILKVALGCQNSSVSPPEFTIKYSDNRSKLLLAVEKGIVQLPDDIF